MQLMPTDCNTTDEVLFSNVYANSRRQLPWVKSQSPHDGHAVIIGGGPSLQDHIEEIRWRQSIGQTIFALNNTALFLHARGIVPDNQVILDARERNNEFLGYANHHYLASQCHLKVFERAGKNVTLWHAMYRDQIEEFEAHLPECGPYALIGGGTTVGLSAMVLVYTLGYRKLHLYGYDSSFRGEASHSYHQTDPDEIILPVMVGDKKFRASLAMAWQAKLFPTLSDKLLDLGCTITLTGDGLLPYLSKVNSSPVEAIAEDAKYRAMWGRPEYRQVSPGERIAQTFLEIAKPMGTVLDLGCGTGRAAVKISEVCSVVMVDFADNCLDDEAKGLPFVQADLSKEIPVKAEYGFCADVMEHIPPDQVDDVLRNVMGACGKVFFQISLVPDSMGALIGQPLHLTVKPFQWWATKFVTLGYSIEWFRDDGNSALFYISTT